MPFEATLDCQIKKSPWSEPQFKVPLYQLFNGPVSITSSASRIAQVAFSNAVSTEVLGGPPEQAFRLPHSLYTNQKSLSALKFLLRGEEKQLREISLVSIRAL